MTKEQDRQPIPFIELMYYLFEDAMKRGEIPPGEYITIISGEPLPEDEGDTPHSEELCLEVCEPVSEYHEHVGVVTITADLPGTTPEDIRYTLKNGVLYLAAHAGSVIYRAAYIVDEEATETLIHTIKNGVIEFTYKKESHNTG